MGEYVHANTDLRYAMIGFSPTWEPFATMGVTTKEAETLARARGLDRYMLFAHAPDRVYTRGMIPYRLIADKYKIDETKRFAAELSPDLARAAGYKVDSGPVPGP
jgi:hypothetical protein